MNHKISKLFEYTLVSTDKEISQGINRASGPIDEVLDETFKKTINLIKLIGIGVDLREFMKFKNLTPRTSSYTILDMVNSASQFEANYFPQNQEFSLSQKDFDYCLYFVLDVAMKVYK